MFGIELTRSEGAGLIAVAYLVLRVLSGVGRVLGRYGPAVRRVVSPRPLLWLLSGVAGAAMVVALVSITTDWPARGFRVVVYGVAAFAGFLLGIMFDMVIDLRLWRVSD